MNKKSVLLIGLGSINLLHAGLHLLQFLQSILLVTTNVCQHNIFTNPIFNLIWVFIGLFTLIIGIKDFKHHKKCNDKNG